MITQELVAFIKQQLQEGKSKEQIANILTPHGWALEDINSVFSQIMPTTQPVIQATAPQVASVMNTVGAASSTAQVTAETSAIANQSGGVGSSLSSDSSNMGSVQVGALGTLKNPGAVMAGIAMIVSAITTTLAMYFSQMSTLSNNPTVASLLPIAPIDQNSMVAGMLAMNLVTIILTGLITKLVTKILSIEPRTFAKAFVFASTMMLLTGIFSLITLTGLPVYVTVLPGLVAWIVFFWYYYGSSILKAIGAFALSILAGGLVAVVMFFGVTSLGGLVMSSLMKSQVNSLREENVKMIETLKQQALENGASNNGLDGANAGQIQAMQNLIQDASSAALAEQALAGLSSNTQEADQGTQTDTATSTDAVSLTAIAENPEFSHVKDAFPVGFPLPKEEEVITATVLSANAFEGVRYILEYTNTHSLAYLRNAMKTSLEKAGYSYAINETNQDYRVITATKVVRSTVRSFKIVLEQTGKTATVHAVLNQ